MSNNRQRAAQKQLLDDYRHVFSSEAGKRVLNDLVSRHFMLRTTYNPSIPHEIYVNEGMRQPILYMLAQIGETEFDLLRRIEEIGRERRANLLNTGGPNED